VTTFSRILCVVDPTQDEQPALGRARWFAKRSGAAIDLHVCYYDEYLSGHRFFDSSSLSKARAKALNKQQEKLDALAKPLRDEGLSVSTTATWDHPLDEGIVRQSQALGADIVFKDIHYHSPLSRALFTHTDWALIRTCPVPLWLVSPHDIVDPPNIIAAIDPFNVHDKPAALDKQLLDVGQIVATHTNGILHAFHCFDPRGITAAVAINTYAPMPMAMPELERELLEHHQSRFSEITEHHGIPKDQSHLAVGSVRDELSALATTLNAALVVMGAISRNTMERLFIGATAEQTLGRLPCDLLVIKPDSLAKPVDFAIRDVA
jgi:universal stress protein E